MIRIVGLHITAPNLAPYAEALRAHGLECTADWWVSTGSQYSGGYDTTTGIASRHRTLRGYLEGETQWEPGDTLVLVAWSAGCWAVQAWLRQAIGTEDFDLADAVLLLDGAHLTDPRVEGLVAYARSAMVGRHLLVSTNSDIPVQGYKSTSEAAVWLLDKLGVEKPARTRDEAGQVGGLHVIDYGGQTAADHVDHVKVFGPRLMNELVGPWLLQNRLVDRADPPVTEVPDSGADTIPGQELGTLGERRAAYCLTQMRLANPPVSATIARWLRLSVRSGSPIWGPGTSTKALAGLNFCAAAQSAALVAVANEHDDLPHLPRAGVVELVSDALERSRWHEVSEVRAGVWAPQIGDLAVYDRSKPGRPETAWWRHVDCVLDSIDATGCRTIGANEGADMWRIECLEYAQASLLGFIASSKSPPIHLLSPEEVQEKQDMALRVGLADMMVRYWEIEA